MRFVSPLENKIYFEKALFLYLKYSKFMEDDFSISNANFYQYFLNLIERTSPFFYLIIEDESVCGIVYLDNIIGNDKYLFSAELTTCFDQKYWGNFTKICAYIFIKYCFENFGFQKIKALVYPENFRVKTLLKNAGFIKESLLKNETIRFGKMQDIEVYSVYKTNYMKG